MNGMIEGLNRAAESWWPTVVHGGWQSAAAALVILTIVWWAKRWPAPLRCGLVVVALVKFLCPPLLAVPTGVFSHLQPAVAPDAATAGPIRGEATDRADESRDENPGSSGQSPESRAGQAAIAGSSDLPRRPGQSQFSTMHDRARSGVARDAATSDGMDDTGALAAQPPAAPMLHWTAGLMLVHALGVVFMLTCLARQVVRLRRLIRTARPCERVDVNRWLGERGRQLGLRRTVRLLVSDAADSPMAFGVLRPTVLLPAGVLTLPRRDVETVLVHELAHLRRGDAWMNWIQAAVCALWWFHPLAWLTARTARRLREDCCDDLLLLSGVTEMSDYCDTLLRIAAQGQRRPPVGIACGMADRLHPLAGRLQRIMDGNMHRSAGLSSMGFLGVVVAACLLLPGLSRASGEPYPDPPASEQQRPGPEADGTSFWLPVQDLDAGSATVTLVMQADDEDRTEGQPILKGRLLGPTNPITTITMAEGEATYPAVYAVVAVRGLYPLGQQLTELGKALDVPKEQAADLLQIADLEIQRRVIPPVALERNRREPIPETPWETVSIQRALKLLQSTADFAPDPVPAAVRHPVITMPLPQRADGEWTTDLASHPLFLEAYLKRLRENAQEQANQPLEKWVLLRYLDFDAEPGKFYAYRVRLKLANPARGLAAAADPRLKRLFDGDSVWTAWSKPVSVIHSAPRRDPKPTTGPADTGRARTAAGAVIDFGLQETLTGKWLMTLPAGFEHMAAFHQQLNEKDAPRYRLEIEGKAVVLEGAYEIRKDRLVVVEPDDERMTGFEWKALNKNVLQLVGQRLPSPNGANYLGATLTRQRADDSTNGEEIVPDK